jgi:melibiose permease/lactose/raffinose/galactose permease
LPLLCILVGYWVYRRKYIIDSAMYQRILGDLQARGQIKLG